MATNPIGHSTANLTANLPKPLKASIAERAAENNLSMSTFVRVILEDAIRRDVSVKTTSTARLKDQKALIHDVISINLDDDDGNRETRKFDHYLSDWRRRSLNRS